LPRLRFEKIW